MSKRLRNSKKINSSCDSLFSFSSDTAPITDCIPYDADYDVSKNGINHILNSLFLVDVNICDGGTNEPIGFFDLFKL